MDSLSRLPMSPADSAGDEEKGFPVVKGELDLESVGVERVKEETPESFYVAKFGIIGPYLEKLFTSGVEARGVERVPEDQRVDSNVWNSLLMWWSINTVLTTIPVGVLAQSSFSLTFPHAVATILCFGVLGAIPSAFIATLGPQTGMRTMIISRYSSGYFGCSIFSFINILTQLGFSTTCVILGGQTLASINPGTIPLTAGIIIVAVCSLIPCFIGYRMVHLYERYAWMVVTVIMFMLWGLGAKAGYDINAQKPLEDTGINLIADILSFGGIVYGSFSWVPVAADYNVQLPANTSSIKVFFLTYFGLYIPICFVEILGAFLMTITNPAYTDAFASGSTGGLISQVLSPWKGGGKFILTLLALSVIANNIPNTYSAALCMQALGRPFSAVPRVFWTVLTFVLYTVASVAGREHFSEILSNVLSMLGYWTAFFAVIIAEEHFIFRRKNGPLGGYDFTAYEHVERLPVGVAGITAALCGIAGAVVGMSEVYYVGPIAKMIGESGGDLGFELAAGFAAVVFPPLRWLEIRLTGR